MSDIFEEAERMSKQGMPTGFKIMMGVVIALITAVWITIGVFAYVVICHPETIARWQGRYYGEMMKEGVRQYNTPVR